MTSDGLCADNNYTNNTFKPAQPCANYEHSNNCHSSCDDPDDCAYITDWQTCAAAANDVYQGEYSWDYVTTDCSNGNSYCKNDSAGKGWSGWDKDKPFGCFVDDGDISNGNLKFNWCCNSGGSGSDACEELGDGDPLDCKNAENFDNTKSVCLTW